MDSDGSNKVQLTSNSSDEKYAVWNHAGNKIAFTRWYPLELWRGGGYAYQLWIMNSDGSNPQKQNVNDTWPLISPTWSPDDTKIAFASCYRGNIYSYDIAAATTTDITPPDEQWPSGVISRVSWGPTDRIAYDRWPVGIQTIDSSGGDYQVIVPEFEIGHPPVEPDWSPNGTRFVLSLCGANKEKLDLALAWNIPNSREEVLENTASVDEWPSWNPANESEIVFMSGGDYFFGSHDIWLMAIGPTPEEHDILVTFDKGFLDVPLNTLYDVVASVKNTGTVSDTFNLEITNNPCGLSATITPQNVTLSPLEEQQVTVQVYVPDTVTEPSCTLQLSAISVATGIMDTDDITMVSGCSEGALAGANLAVVYDSNSIWAYNPQTDAWKGQHVVNGIQGVEISDNLAVVYGSDDIWAYNPQLDTWKEQ
jgi:Tol biopolymer transport system component